MNYLSVCSGIEAASVAWHLLGWRPFAFSEIEKFPSRVLAHHYPDTPNFGDMTKFQEWPDATIDVLVGGTPCQSFSVAGLRAGLADPRGNLMLTYLAIAGKYRPEWLVWENVPGVLSSNGGRDFGALLGGLAKLGYGFAYRILDAQYVRVDGLGRAVPQRRRRVFVVGCLGDWRRAAAVLFERESLRGNSAPSRKAGEGFAGAVGDCLTKCRESSPDEVRGTGNLIPQPPPISLCLNAGAMGRIDAESETLIPIGGCFGDAHSLRASGFDASEDGTGRGTPLVPITFGWQNSSQQGASASAEITPTLDKSKTPAIAFAQNQRDEVRMMNVAGALAAEPGMKQQTYAQTSMGVRRLTPRECERLQGFPDDYTNIPGAKDGPRYKSLGNSMAVNVMRWIGTRIAMVDAISDARELAA
jgi:DNA (cytosine-5)-methyltransferase 1